VSGDYRYEILDFVEPVAVSHGPILLEPTEGGSRLRVPKRRDAYDAAVVELLLEVDRLRRLGPVPGLPATPKAPRHGVFDVAATEQREVWSQGNLDKVIPRRLIDRAGHYHPWGKFPDYLA
jgi:hypothetical protein